MYTLKQGWAGFAFPILPSAIQDFRDLSFSPASATALTIDGNTAHSTGWWWKHAAGFYVGGALYYNDDNLLEYNPGRNADLRLTRRPCNVPIDDCDPSKCNIECPLGEESFIRVTNTKVYQISGTGFNSWSGTMEISGYEAHDVGLSLESLSRGFWIDNLLAVCR